MRRAPDGASADLRLRRLTKIQAEQQKVEAQIAHTQDPAEKRSSRRSSRAAERDRGEAREPLRSSSGDQANREAARRCSPGAGLRKQEADAWPSAQTALAGAVGRARDRDAASLRRKQKQALEAEARRAAGPRRRQLQAQAADLQAQAAQLQAQQAQLQGQQQSAQSQQKQAEAAPERAHRRADQGRRRRPRHRPAAGEAPGRPDGAQGVRWSRRRRSTSPATPRSTRSIADHGAGRPATADLVRTAARLSHPRRRRRARTINAYVGGSTASNVDLAAEISSTAAAGDRSRARAQLLRPAGSPSARSWFAAQAAVDQPALSAAASSAC